MSTDMIDVVCKKCSRTLVIPGEYAGKKIKCAKCQHEFTADYHERHGVPVVATPQPLPPSLAPWEYSTAISISLHLFGALLALIAAACVFNLAFVGALKGGDPIHSGLLLIAILIYWLIMEIRALRRVYVIRSRKAGGYAE